MSFLRKPTNISLYYLSILRRFSTLTSKPFPEDPTPAYYDEITAEAADAGNFNALRDILNKRVQDGCFNTKQTFRFITNTNFSPSVLNDVLTTLSLLNPGFTRKSAFDSLIIRLCKLNLVDDALRVVETMTRVESCNPNACTFYPIINLLTREKSLDDARRVVDLMVRLGVKQDLTIHNMFLMTHCFSGDVDSAAGVLKTIEEEGLIADTRTYDALVLGACKAGKVDSAMVLVRRMVDDGVPLLYSTHMSVIVALLKMNCFELAERYVRCFVGKCKALDAELFGCLGGKLMAMKRVKEAVLIFGEMKQKGLPMSSKSQEFYEMNVGVGKKVSNQVEMNVGVKKKVLHEVHNRNLKL